MKLSYEIRQRNSLIALIIALTGIIVVLCGFFLPYFTYTYSTSLSSPQTTVNTGLTLTQDISSSETSSLSEFLEDNRETLINKGINVDNIVLGFVFTTIGALGSLILSLVIATLIGISILTGKRVIYIISQSVALVSFALSVLTLTGVILLLNNLSFEVSFAILIVNLTVTCTSQFGASSVLYLTGAVITAVALFFVDFSTMNLLPKKTEKTDNAEEAHNQDVKEDITDTLNTKTEETK